MRFAKKQQAERDWNSLFAWPAAAGNGLELVACGLAAAEDGPELVACGPAAAEDRLELVARGPQAQSRFSISS